MCNFSSIVAGNGTINLLVDGEIYVVGTDHPSYQNIRNSLDEPEKVLNLLDIRKSLESYMGADTKITEDGRIFFRGVEQSGDMVDRIIEQLRKGYDVTPTVLFFENCLANPKPESVEMLYKFLRAEGFPLTDDGCFLGYKYVQKKADGHLYDQYSGIYCNDPGKLVEMPRDEVAFAPEQPCSAGLHVGNFNYVRGQQHVVLVKVNPKDAVSVPNDNNFGKLRCCRYWVVEKYDMNKGPLEDPIYGVADAATNLSESTYKRSGGSFDNATADHWQ